MNNSWLWPKYSRYDNLPIFNPGYHIIGSMEVNDPLPKVSPDSVGKVSTKNISNRTIKESRLGMSIMIIHNYNYARDFRISEIRVWGYSWWGGVGRSGCELATKSIWSQCSTSGTPLQNRPGTPTLIISGDLVHLRFSEFSDLKVNI